MSPTIRWDSVAPTGSRLHRASGAARSSSSTDQRGSPSTSPCPCDPSGRIDIVQRYTLEPLGEATRVRRVATLGLPQYLRPLAWFVVRITSRDSGRTLAALKSYCDALPGRGTP
jgi:hypothetical protein